MKFLSKKIYLFSIAIVACGICFLPTHPSASVAVASIISVKSILFILSVFLLKNMYGYYQYFHEAKNVIDKYLLFSLFSFSVAITSMIGISTIIPIDMKTFILSCLFIAVEMFVSIPGIIFLTAGWKSFKTGKQENECYNLKDSGTYGIFLLLFGCQMMYFILSSIYFICN